MKTINCPLCKTDNTYERDLVPHSDHFCTNSECDFPLFWDQKVIALVPDDDDSDLGSLRRLPGVAGRDDLTQQTCPSCAEPNHADATNCIACASLLNPPPPQPAPEPAPYVPQPPAKRGIDPVLVVLVIVILAILAFLIFYAVTI